ncbi:MAG: glycerol-3-phosphate 1-O-acyltransferase PlsY [Myxococcota bacterium]
MMPLLFLLFTYLFAGVPFGLLVGTLYGDDQDVRTAGSGNIGATNVARVYGWRLGVPVLLLDLFKGLGPVMLASSLFGSEWMALLTAAAAFGGHTFSPYLHFKGGKGVATGGGAMLALAPVPTLGAFGAWGTILVLTGRSSLASLGATVAILVLCGALQPTVLTLAVPLSIGIVALHSANIRRLLRGDEDAVIQPVRWGRSANSGLSLEELVERGPAGGSLKEAWWHQAVGEASG